ncbi:MAG: response regulator SirA [Chloroflexi bacterium]|nr:MAG: response regulator SirA [Chloroflexota bacterium]
MPKINTVVKRTGAVVPFTPERITNAIYRAAVAVGGRDRETAEQLANQVVGILEEQTLDGTSPTIEEIQDVVEKVLIENGHAKVAKAYILYREERARRRRERAQLASRPSENIPWAKIWHVLDWAVDHKVHTTAALNRRIREGDFDTIVLEAETAYNEDVENAAENIAERASELKMVIITGPSSSGKTTTTMKIAQRLKRMRLKLVTLNVDNYFFDLALHPIDEFGDYDFETPQALDLQLINEHLKHLVEGEEVMIPYYDFKTGMRQDNATPMRLGKKEILLIDSLHGLFPEMTGDIPDEKKFKLYLEPLLQLKDSQGRYARWTDLRLIRRMLRDASHRAYDPRQTLLHWHYVRTSELRNIIPNIGNTDYIVNTGMPYELPIYRARMFDQFAAWTVEYRDDPLRQDAYERASRVYALLQELEPVYDESSIPGDSVLREFIGGSIYKY